MARQELVQISKAHTTLGPEGDTQKVKEELQWEEWVDPSLANRSGCRSYAGAGGVALQERDAILTLPHAIGVLGLC